MDYDKNDCPIVKVDGFIEKGKQFDIEINLPEDNRNVIFGVIKDCFKDPVEDAVVKLIEVCREYGKEERKPVSHTFTDKDGEFVLVLFALIKNTKYNSGLTKLNMLKFAQNANVQENV